MARPERTDAEKLRGRMRTVALVRELAWRVGAANPHQFAGWFDERTGVSTQTMGKWRFNFNGERPLSEQQLNWLSIFPELGNVRRFYLAGPADLWRALWGEDANELWALCGHHVHPYAYDDPDTLLRITDAVLLSGPGLCFEESLYNFECSILLGQQYGQALDLRNLTESIAFCRLHQAINRIARIDGVGAYRCVRMCFDDDGVSDHLSRLGIREMLDQELTRTEVARLESEPSYRAAVGVDDVDSYARNPFKFCSIVERMEALRIN